MVWVTSFPKKPMNRGIIRATIYEVDWVLESGNCFPVSSGHQRFVKFNPYNSKISLIICYPKALRKFQLENHTTQIGTSSGMKTTNLMHVGSVQGSDSYILFWHIWSLYSPETLARHSLEFFHVYICLHFGHGKRHELTLVSSEESIKNCPFCDLP